MRLKITFVLNEKPQIIPLNYKYPVSSWIYKTFAKADTTFTELLHQQGYRLETGKTFKLFTFSDLQIPKGNWKILGDRMKIWANDISLIIAFQLPEQLQHFVAGLFKGQEVQIGDEISSIHLTVVNVEALKNDLPDEKIFSLKWLSPIFLAKKVNGMTYPAHISPDDKDYSGLFIKNLLDKYQAFCEQSGETPENYNANDVHFIPLHNNPKSVKQTIKAFTKSQTEIRAFKFDFKLQAPKKLVELGLNAGFGAENAQGFGCCELK